MGYRNSALKKRAGDAVGQAAQFVVEQLERRTLLTVSVTGIPNWFEQGPGPIQGGQVRGIPNQPVTGAINAIVVDKDEDTSGRNTIWVATVGGGIWKTTDG